jgi:hypothetical protein
MARKQRYLRAEIRDCLWLWTTWSSASAVHSVKAQVVVSLDADNLIGGAESFAPSAQKAA